MNRLVMHIVRSGSGHVCFTCFLTLALLGSLRVTRVLRYYERLRLPAALHPPPRCLGLSKAARCSAPAAGSPWLPHTRNLKLDRVCKSRVGTACSPLAHTALSPAGTLKPSARSNAVISGLQPSGRSICRLSTSLAFVPTHQAHCCQHACKARYRACG